MGVVVLIVPAAQEADPKAMLDRSYEQCRCGRRKEEADDRDDSRERNWILVDVCVFRP